jgi:plastocyanin
MSLRAGRKSAIGIAFLAAFAAICVINNARADTAPRAPKTWDVQMTNEGGTLRFEPKEITIAVGDTVKWTQTGGSHDIRFWPDSVPMGAVPLLNTAMKDTVAALRTMRFPQGPATYTIVFAGMPKGVYKYYCGPHRMRGMIASITIQ